MNQSILLLWACRRAFVRALFLGVICPLALYVLVAGGIVYVDHGELFSMTGIGALGGVFHSALREHTFAITLVLACLAAFCHPMAGVYATLTKLPVPVSARQRAYIPFAFALLNWAILMGIYAALLSIGQRPEDKGVVSIMGAGAVSALPLGLLIIAVVNRNAGNPNAQFGVTLPLTMCYPLVLIRDTGILAWIALAEDLYAMLAPALVAATLLLTWETPRRHEAWRRAAFITFPTPAGKQEMREPLAPQRLHWLGVLGDLITFCTNRTGEILCFVLYLFLMQFIFVDSGRFPLWADRLLSAYVVLHLLVAAAYFAGKLYLLQCVNTQRRMGPPWAQPILRVAHAVEKLGARNRMYPGRSVIRDSNTGRYRLHFESGNSPRSSDCNNIACKPINLSYRLRWVVLIQLLLFGVMFSVIGNGVGNYREGSNIQGDTQYAPDEDYETTDTFSQNYVALNLGEETDPALLDAAIASIQMAVAESPDPANWLAGLKTVDGNSAHVPRKYRLEVSRPQPHIVVVQSMGLYWDRAGHLAYALARQLLKAPQLPSGTNIDEKFSYYRSLEPFTTAYRFLDNTVHWVQPEEDNGDGKDYAPAPQPGDTPVFVDRRNTSGHQNGKSWATAYDTIQDGIDAAYRRRIAGVWVATGTYGEERYGDGALYMRSGVHVYGGFRGDESVRTQRDAGKNPTIIDGARARKGKPAFHVVVGANSVTLDGFTITGGDANGAELWEDCGGGMLAEDCDPVIVNCRFLGNNAKDRGGAVYVFDGNAAIDGCHFEGNRAGGRGGAFEIAMGHAKIRRSVFVANHAVEGGSAIDALGETFVAENCVFTGNTVDDSGGAVINGLEFTLTYCTVVGNGDGALFDRWPTLATITNSIMWSTGQALFRSEANIVHSIVQGGHPGEGNLDLDPLFRDAVEGDYRLMPGSPAIDAGTSDDAPPDDIDGRIRPQGEGVDIGAYEFADE